MNKKFPLKSILLDMLKISFLMRLNLAVLSCVLEFKHDFTFLLKVCVHLPIKHQTNKRRFYLINYDQQGLFGLPLTPTC